jgi:hypothetical protein
MIMKWWLAGIAASVLSAPVVAGSYHVVLQPENGKMLVGHAGVQAVDDRTATALVRVISPGNAVDRRGTVRVLVMNLGPKTFEFGPDQVRLTLADGTVLQPSSVDEFEKGRMLVERESRYAAATDLRIRNNLPGLDQQSNGGPTAQSRAPISSSGPSVSGTSGNDRRTDEALLPGAETLNAIYQLLIPQPVAPNKAWGGYYVFDMPKAVFARRTDQPLSISVTTGAEQHRFNAVLKWKR